jgi:hypothetical protein
MERFVVTHTRDGLWSVSHQEHTLSVYPTEEQALAATFKLASKLSQIGHRAVVSMTRAGTGSKTRPSTQIHRGYS